MTERLREDCLGLVADFADLSKDFKIFAILIHQLLLLPRNDRLSEVLKIDQVMTLAQLFKVGNLRHKWCLLDFHLKSL
jgi:hypothetical protein